MKINPLISVIVPVYKVEAYLEKCVYSILNQTYKELEIILVDDGSPDECGKICDNLILVDRRIKALHKENGGLSDARNVGMLHANGAYYMFIDSDDFIHPRMISILMDCLSENNGDIAVCNFESIQDDYRMEEFEEIKTTPIIIEEEADRRYYFLEDTYTQFTVAWNKLYKRELFEDITFPKGKVHEDEFTTYKLLHKAKKVIYMDAKLYFYVQRSNSIMAEGFNEKSLYRLEAYLERMNYYKKEHNMYWFSKILFLYRLFLLKYTEQNKLYEKTNPFLLVGYKKKYNKIIMRTIYFLPIKFNLKISYLYYWLFPDVYFRTRYLKGEKKVENTR